jgi:uncharacterized membrane protein YcgQ (UPF0703/DUF1980 family)
MPKPATIIKGRHIKHGFNGHSVQQNFFFIVQSMIQYCMVDARLFAPAVIFENQATG